MDSQRTSETVRVGTTGSGPANLAELQRAHPRVAELFWTALRRDVDREHALCRAVQGTHGVAPRGWRPRTQWGDGWRRRAKAYAVAEEIGLPESDLEDQRERLRDIPPEDYVPRLTGEEFDRGRMLCPLPGHDDREPSFYVRRGNRWQCFGCGEKGDVYTLGSLLWNLPLRGSGFLDLHRELMERLA